MKNSATKKLDNKRSVSGFTLIELLVVISIIALLSSVVFASLNSARKKAEVAKVLQEVASFKKAMELYRLNTGAYYNVAAYVRPSNGQWTPFKNAMAPYIAVANLNFFSATTDALGN